MRWVHAAWALLARPVLDLMEWCLAPTRRYWAGGLLLAAVATPLAMPFDPDIRDGLMSVYGSMGGDVRREIGAWQQYGALVSVLVIALVIIKLDPGKVRRLADLALASVLTATITLVLKIFIGRPRPKYDDPFTFLWPGGQYPIVRDGKPVLAGTLDPSAGSELWSMPSSHTSAAAALTVFIITLYPQLRWIAIALLVIVIIGRTTLGNPPAHWPSDVIAGAALGWLIAGIVMHHSLGTRLLDRVRHRKRVPDAAAGETQPADSMTPTIHALQAGEPAASHQPPAPKVKEAAHH